MSRRHRAVNNPTPADPVNKHPPAPCGV